MTIDNSRVVGNSASKNATGHQGGGGGILNNLPGQLPAALTLDHSGVTGSAAHTGGGIFDFGGPVSLRQTMVRDNRPDNCRPAGSVPRCVG